MRKHQLILAAALLSAVSGCQNSASLQRPTPAPLPAPAAVPAATAPVATPVAATRLDVAGGVATGVRPAAAIADPVADPALAGTAGDLLPAEVSPWTGDRATRVRLVAGDGKYPLRRREEVLVRGADGIRVAEVREMVADHVLVSVVPGAEAQLGADLAAAGCAIRRRLPGGDVVLASFPYTAHADYPRHLDALAIQAGVAVAEPDWIVRVGATPDDPELAATWGLHNTGQTGGTADADIDAPEAWEVATGSRSVIVGVIDTGIDLTHPELAANLWSNPGETGNDGNGADKRSNGLDDDGNGYVDDWRGWDFANDDNNPQDDHFHGTHCAGTIGATGNDGTGVAGVCWQVSLVGLKFMTGSGSGAISDALDAVRYANRMGFRITSNSWGGGGFSQTLLDAIVAGQDSGHLFIAAAGNSSQNMDATPSYPASYDAANLISVAASDHSDQRANFSNYGTTAAGVDLAAPGVAIYSTTPMAQTPAMAQAGFAAGHASLNGTSMACPHVAGVAALVLAAYPSSTWSQIKTRIIDNCDATAMAGVPGGRRLNAALALHASAPADPPADPPADDPPPADPAGFTLAKFGLGLPGMGSETNGIWQLIGSGAGAAGRSDNCYTALADVDGDAIVTARLTGLAIQYKTAQAGIMLRAGDFPNAQSFFLGVQGTGKLMFGRRLAYNASTSITYSRYPVALPVWLRLERRGTVVSALYSADGENWALFGSAVAVLPDAMRAGLSVGAGAYKYLAAGTFDNVALDSPSVDLPALPLTFNFQPGTALPAVVDGQPWTIADGTLFGARRAGGEFGWASGVLTAYDRNSKLSPDQRYDTCALVYAGNAWEVALPNGTYTVTLCAGDAGYYRGYQRWTAEGVSVVDRLMASTARWATGTATVEVADGRLTIALAPGLANGRLAWLKVEAYVPAIATN